MKIKGSSYFLIFILLFMVFAFGQAIVYRRMEAKFLILITAAITVLLGTIELTKEILAARRKKLTEEETHKKEKERKETYQLIFTMAWIGGVCLGVYLLGFLAALPLFIFSYLMVRGRNILASVSFSLIVTLCAYTIFELGFKFYLYRGLIHSFLD